MCSAEPLREFIRERLTAAAEEIFTQLEKTIVQYEEEIHRQRRLLELTWRPRSGSQRAEPAPRPDPKADPVLFDQDKPEPEPPQVKEEPKREDFLLVTSSDEPEPNQLVSLGAEVADQNQEGSGDDADPDRTGATQTVGCDVCGRSFRQRYEMKIHRRTHTGERPFCCRVCGKRFVRSSGLSVHMRVHTGHKPYGCRFCGRSFSQLSSLNYHRRTHSELQLQEERSSSLDPEEPEPELPEMKQEEEELQPVLKQEAEIVMVTLGWDESGPEPNTGQNSAAAQNQNQDQDAEPGPPNRPNRTRTWAGQNPAPRGPVGSEKPLRCDVCGKAYRHNYELKAHRRVHTGERPFCCQTCGKGFMRSSGLVVHTRIHTGQRPYSCRTCGKSFTQLNSLNYHRGTHSDFHLQEDRKGDQRSSSLGQEEPEPVQMKEEGGPDGEQLVLNQPTPGRASPPAVS